MRTLKKVLALTVVLATLLSISSFAAFSDEESIDESFVDAVNLLGALNVMTGDTEGTFRPNDTIMRAEAAKMIYVIRNGGVDDQAAGWTGMSTFSDVTPGVWYEGYVNYCASLNIIAGIGGGLFNPSGAVTGVELAKMMLVVADYRPDIEKYTGTGWNLNVIRDAQSAGMFKGYTLAYSAAATREQAAQLFANAILETEMAVYIGDVRVNNAAMLGEAETVGGRFFDLAVVTGVLTKVPHVSLPVAISNNTTDDVVADAQTATLNANDELARIETFNDDEHTTSSFEFAADPDLLYQEVNVIYQEANEGGILDRKSKVYAVLPTGDSDVYETTMDAITVELRDDSKTLNTKPGTDNYNPVTIQFEGFNGNRAQAQAENFTLPVVKNLYEGATMDVQTNDVHTADWDTKVYVIDPSAINMLATTSAAPVRLIDIDADGELDVAFVTTPYYGTVANYDADRFEFTTDAELIDGEVITSDRREADFDNFTFEDEIEKDDVIAVTLDVLSGEMKYNVALVEPTVGALTRVYSTLPDNEVVIGGETYGFYGLKFDGKMLNDPDVDLSAERYHSDLGEEVTVYTDGKYILTAEVAPVTLGNGFAFVKNYNIEGNSFDSMLTDSKALLLELVLPTGETVVKEYDREAVTSETSGWYDESDLVNRNDPANPVATDLLKAMMGNIVEYSADGDNVAFRTGHKTATDKEDLEPNYHVNAVDNYRFNSSTGIFRTTVSTPVSAFTVNENSVFFLPTYKDGVTDPQNPGEITKVAVINGDELRGTPTITVKVESVSGVTTANESIMQLVTALQSGVRTAAFGVLDAGSTVSDTGVYAYTLSQDWDQDETDDDDGYRINAILSDAGEINEDAIIHLNNSDFLANKVYKATRNSDGTYDFDKVELDVDMQLGSIDGRQGDRVTIDGSVYVVTDETVIFVVNTRGTRVRISEGSVSDLSTAYEDDEGNVAQNILFEENDNELTVVYVEAVDRDLESLIIYEETKSVDLTAGDLALPALNHGTEFQNMNSDKFNVTVSLKNTTDDVAVDPPVLDSAKSYELTLTFTAKDGVLFGSNFKADSVKLPDGYVFKSAEVSGDGKRLTVVATIANTAINSDVTADAVEELFPEVTDEDLAAPANSTAKTLTATELGNNPMVEKITLTYTDTGDNGGELNKVEVTFTDAYDPSAMTPEELEEAVAAIAAKLDLAVDDNIDYVLAALALMAQTPANEQAKITKAELTEDGVLVLTIGEEATEEPVEVTYEFTKATLSADPQPGNYEIKETKNSEHNYTIKISAENLVKHPNENQAEGYWVGVQIGAFSDNVKGWRTAYKGYDDTEGVDAAFEAGNEMIANSWDEKQDASFLAWYRDAEKGSTNNAGRGWVVGIQLLDDNNKDANVLATVYVTLDVSGVQISE